MCNGSRGEAARKWCTPRNPACPAGGPWSCRCFQCCRSTPFCNWVRTGLDLDNCRCKVDLDKDHSHHTYIYEYLQLRLERLDQEDVPITAGIAEFGNGCNELR